MAAIIRKYEDLPKYAQLNLACDIKEQIGDLGYLIRDFYFIKKRNSFECYFKLLTKNSMNACKVNINKQKLN